jgi:hypothetical protein
VCILQLKSIFPLADIWRHQVLSAEAPQGKATWVGVDFGSSCTASITSVGFAHGSNVSRDHVLGSFLFQGSNDGKKWITLQEVMREKASVTYCGWSLPQAHNPLRYFRIMMTSPTSSNSRRICIKNLTLLGSLFVDGMRYLEGNTALDRPTNRKYEQIVRPSVAHIRPKSGVCSEHAIQICDSSLTNLIHIVANMSWLVSSTQGLACSILKMNIEPPKELLSHHHSNALSDLLALVSASSDTYLESVFSYLAEMLVELSVGCRNDHIYRLFLFGRSNQANTPFVKMHAHTRKLASKLAALASVNNFRNLQFTTTIWFRLNSPSSAELQRSKNQMEEIIEIARKGVPVSKLPPFDVSSLIEFNLRREVHNVIGSIMPETLLKHIQCKLESRASVLSTKNIVDETKDATVPDRMAYLEAQLGATLLREHELKAKIHAMHPASAPGGPRFDQSSRAGNSPISVTSMLDAKLKNLEFELKEAAKREEALKNAPYFGQNPADSFDIAQLKQKNQELANQLSQRDKTIEVMTSAITEQHVNIQGATRTATVSYSDAHLETSEVQSMQALIVDLQNQIQRLKSDLKDATSREESLISSQATKTSHDMPSKVDKNSATEHTATLENNLQKQVEINQSLTAVVASRDRQVHDLDMQVARLQAKLQESYEEVDSMTSDQASSNFV